MTTKPPGTLLKAATIISAAYIISRVMGYLREALLAARFGATHTTDAYLLAQDIPAGLFTAVAVALFMVFIPLYQDVLHRRGIAAARRLTNTVLSGTLLLAVGLLAILWLLAPVLIPRLAPGLPADALALAVRLTRIMLPMMPFLGAAGVAAAALNANRHFTMPALAPLASNIFVIGSLLLVTGPGQIGWVAYGVVAGAFAGMAIQLPMLPRVGLPFRFQWQLSDPNLLRAAAVLLPVLVTTVAQQAQQYVDRYMASSLSEGSISALNYATRLNSLPYGVIGVAIATVLYPNLAELAAAKEREQLRRTMNGGLRILAYVLLPMAMGMLVFRQEIVQLFFQRGAFDARATWVTAYALQFYSMGILFFGWMDFVNRCFFALQDFVTPMWAGLAMVVLNVGLNVALVSVLQQGGLALGTSLSTALVAVTLVGILQKRLGKVGLAGLFRTVVLCLMTSLAGAVAGRLVYVALAGAVPGGGFAALALPLGAGLLTIAVLHVALGILVRDSAGAEVLGHLSRSGRLGKEGSGR